MPPFVLPVELALARPVDEIPTGSGWSLEPKWDGWRCQIHTASGRVWSRHNTELSRAFSDVAQLARQLPDAVLDGELVAVLDSGDVAFDRLQSRAGRGPQPGSDFSVHVALFDILSTGTTDLRRRPYGERRAELLRTLEGGPPALTAVPATSDLETAMAWVGALGGVEGVVGKPLHSPYVGGRTGSGWVKWRQRHTVEAVVIGITGTKPATQAFILGRPRAGRMRAVGVSLPVGSALRRAAAPLLHADGSQLLELPGTVGGLPGAAPVIYLPVLPEVVVELQVDQLQPEFGRYRHRPRALRIRGDLHPMQLSPLPEKGDSLARQPDDAEGESS
ncbi:ATP-dependent DNA ligase [Streptomyces nigrescens]